MRRLWLLLFPAYAQVSPPDSLRELFEKDFLFDIVFERSFPVVPTLTDTYPVTPFLSGHWRVGVVWHWRLYHNFHLAFQPGISWYKHTLRATSASTAPYAEDLPDGYRWLKYRAGYAFFRAGLYWRKQYEKDIFPRYWVEVGGWFQRRIGGSIKYIAERDGFIERVRWERLQSFAPWQGGGYVMLGRQWLGISAYYHLLPIFPTQRAGRQHLRPFPAFSRWEVGFLFAI